MSDGSICIPEMFRGPPRSVNGGYATGAFGRLFTGGDFALPPGEGIEVTLRAPVALDHPFATQRAGDVLQVLDGAQLIAEVRRAPLSLEIPAPPSWDEAHAIREQSPALQRGHHPFLGADRTGVHPICFCCGAELAEDRGLHVFAAPLAGGAQVAAAWSCEPVFADARGELPAEIVCTALDCPGQFAWLAEGTRTGLLGRLTVRLQRPVRAGERCVVTGFPLGHEGRKYFAGTALFDARGALCAYAKAVWIGRT
jgi:hypothetical protein